MNTIAKTQFTRPEVLRCTSCKSVGLSRNENVFVCPTCDSKYTQSEGVLDLRTNPEQDSQLDQETYDAEHGVNLENSKSLYALYEDIFRERLKAMDGDALEIASGSGHLTYGLTNLSSFSQVHCSDISPGFMKRLRERIINTEVRSKTFYYLFDANSFPFRDTSFDLVVGNSVLHHFENFENTLADSFRVLRPGGIAVFGEPVLDTCVFTSLASSLIKGIADREGKNAFSKKENMILQVLSERASYNRANLNSDRKNLEMEDKFQFPINYMRELASKLGYRDFECVSPGPRFDLGEMIKTSIQQVFAQEKTDSKVLDQFDFVFDSLRTAYGEPMAEDVKRHFSIFVFAK